MNSILDFKYTSKEKLENFIFNLYEQEGCDDPIEFLKGNKELMRLTYSRDTMYPLEKVLGIVETFLHVFCNAEEYEICAMIVKTWPELKK